MAIISNEKWISIIMLIAIIIITLLLESYASVVKLEAFEGDSEKNKIVITSTKV